ncbi:type IV conjugative transfer system protein TraL [Acidithiobacillus sp.]|uniref:type IV conjugative transfer system protein TraL n=1 Tax=Acidithiobacillus TaxID=119977 RepID=UPI00094AD7DE
MDEEGNEPRPSPRHIDRKNRLFEYMVILFGPFYLLHTFSLIAGVVTGVVALPLYVRFVSDKQDGYLIHLAYKLGFPVRNLISRKIKRLSP